MNYKTYPPHKDLKSVVKCYWTLEVPADYNSGRQRIIPDGCIEMAFILGDDIKRFISSDDFILQPRAMILGQTIDPFYIQPTGYVNTFAVRFYPYGFANFIRSPIHSLVNKETPLEDLFERETVRQLTHQIVAAANTLERIEVIDKFLKNKLNEKSTIDNIVKSTVDTLFSTNGTSPIKMILNDDVSKRRQLERKFSKQVGISPKQLGRLIRLQTALRMLLNQENETLTRIAYESDYYDQAHFIKDFREFTGTSPKEFLRDDQMALSALFYSQE